MSTAGDNGRVDYRTETYMSTFIILAQRRFIHLLLHGHKNDRDAPSLGAHHPTPSVLVSGWLGAEMCAGLMQEEKEGHTAQ